MTIFQGVDLARTERGAGVQVVSIVPDGLGQVAGRRGTITPSFNAGLTSAVGRTYAMQEMGVATRA